MIKELGEAGFNYVFEGSELVANATEGIRGGIEADFWLSCELHSVRIDFNMR